ncbi:GFA family protein [Parasphingorhabdus litoris]|uniref:GFA family protein n=1 Tax=Parasphingorhabdus litoris TaxID=394733 RepID=A0ABN1AC98_9SPHN|nr:GFA family protein [Parasphingorhabdus litoris]
MKVTGGCYCGAVRYKAEGEPMMKAECFCRECQYITGGGNLLVMAMPVEGFELTKGAVKGFTRDDLEYAVTREFCENCGTHLFTRAPRFKEGVIIKVGSLDDPSVFGKAESANYACDAQPYHRLPDDMPVNQKWMHS